MKKKCGVCGIEYECYDSKGHSRQHSLGKGHSVKYKRGMNTKTCSHKCSVIWNNCRDRGKYKK